MSTNTEEPCSVEEPTDLPTPEEEDDDLFYFESDHLALKGNGDYSEILKTIFILEAQRSRAIKDYEEVVELHKGALKDPEVLLSKLKNGESLGVPDLQIIAEVPQVDWSKYNVKLPPDGLTYINSKSLQKSTSRLTNQERRSEHSVNTYNKPWSIEEQKRLEELLVTYPPEPVELQRFKKIAQALGNRTVKQVTSRVQKYFLKLYKAGLPIPGRIPKYAERCRKSKIHFHQRHNHYLFRPTTFFPQLDVPVVMNEGEACPGPTNNFPSCSTYGNNYLIPSSSGHVIAQHMTEEPKNELDIQLELLQKVKNDKQTENSFQSSFRHFGYRCDFCNEEPIIGTRWHCFDCKIDSIDFCGDCLITQMHSGNPHPIYHKMQPVHFDDNMSSYSPDSSNGSLSDSSVINQDSSEEEASSGESVQDTKNNFDYSNAVFKLENDNDNDGDLDNYGSVNCAEEECGEHNFNKTTNEAKIECEDEDFEGFEVNENAHIFDEVQDDNDLKNLD